MGGLPRRVLAAAERRPVLTVAVLGIGVALVHLWWVAANRPLGAWDADEVGYMATSLRFQRNIEPSTLMPLIDRLTEAQSGPLVPLLGVPLIGLGSRSLGWVQAVQPLLCVLCAVAIAGVTRALGTSRQAILAGVVVLGVPATILAGRSYHYGLAAGATVALAMWALLRSDRGTRRWPMAGFGLATGAMLLSRTMTVSYLPGLAVAALLVVRRDRRSILNLAGAAAIAAGVAGPWWVASWSEVSDYLFRYGYGPSAEVYGAGAILGRMRIRLGVLLTEVRPLLLLPALAAVTASVVLRIRRRREVADALPGARDRRIPALAAVVAIGYLLLLTSANTGILFELPLYLLLVPLILHLSAVLPPRWQRMLGGLALAAALVNLVLVGNVRLGEDSPDTADRSPTPSLFLFGDMYPRDFDLVLADTRLGAGRSARREAAGEWWNAQVALVERLDHRLAGRTEVLQTVTGSSALMNQGSILFAEELLGKAIGPSETPLTRSPDLSAWLEPRSADQSRVLVVIRSRAKRFLEDSESDRLLDDALDRGWEQRDRVPLPDGGDVLVLTHPRSEPG